MEKFITDEKTNEFVFPDGTRIPFDTVEDTTPEWKAILEWASKYIDILEWKSK